jgi:hypothetical protein
MIFGTTSKLASFYNTGTLTYTPANNNVGPTDTTYDFSARVGSGVDGTEYRQSWMPDMRPNATSPMKLIQRAAKEWDLGPPVIPGQYYTGGTNLTGTRQAAIDCQHPYGKVLSATHTFYGSHAAVWSTTYPQFWVQGVAVWPDPSNADGLHLVNASVIYGPVSGSNGYYTWTVYSHVVNNSATAACGLPTPVAPYGFGFSFIVDRPGAGTCTSRTSNFHIFYNVSLIANL